MYNEEKGCRKEKNYYTLEINLNYLLTGWFKKTVLIYNKFRIIKKMN